jgi:hypothetical protein
MPQNCWPGRNLPEMGDAKVRVLSSANAPDRARFNAISAEAEGRAARVTTGVWR